EECERGMPGQRLRPAGGDRRGRPMVLERQRVLISPGVVAREGRDKDDGCCRHANRQPPALTIAECAEPLAEAGEVLRPRISSFIGGDAASRARKVIGRDVPEPLELSAVVCLELVDEPVEWSLEAEGLKLEGGPVVLGARAVRAHGKDRAAGGVL